MIKRKNILLSLLVIFLIALLLIILALSYKKFYNDIFRLSQESVINSLSQQTSSCPNIKNCQLLSGDILIRRHITQKTQLLDKVFNPYFTHSAYYLGEGQIIEAVGQEKNKADEIIISELINTDWVDTDIETWVIIRPKKITPALSEVINNNFKTIANDPNYRFGTPKNHNKKTTCADLIYQQLIQQNIIEGLAPPNYITPDYLYSIVVNKPDDFEMIAQSTLKN